MFLREILEDFGKDLLLIDRFHDILLIIVSQLFRDHVATGIAKTLDMLLRLS